MTICNYLAPGLFKGKTAFVAGGSSGINLGIAKSFAALGADVAICGRDGDKLGRASEELLDYGVEVQASVADVRDLWAVVEALETTRSRLGPISTLVCGAAGNFTAPAEDLSGNGFKTVVDIDLIGSFNTAKAGFDQLRQTRGSLIFISAPQASSPYAFQVHAGAAKAGVDNMMRNLALEWGQYGIRCNSIVPGFIEGTEGVNRLAPSAQARDDLIKTVPLRRCGTVDEIAYLACFLASPMAGYISGSVFECDGGQHLPGSGQFNAIVAAQQQ